MSFFLRLTIPTLVCFGLGAGTSLFMGTQYSYAASSLFDGHLVAESKGKKKRKSKKKGSSSSSKQDANTIESGSSELSEEEPLEQSEKLSSGPASLKTSIAGLVGTVSAEGNIGNPIALGGDAYFRVSPQVQAGGSFLYWSSSANSFDYAATIFDIGGRYRLLSGSISPFFGATFGQTSITVNYSFLGESISNSISSMHVYAVGGADFFTGKSGKFAMGVEARLPLYFAKADEGIKGPSYFLVRVALGF